MVYGSPRETRLPQLAALMRDHRIRHLPVVRDGHLVGLITSHDLERVSPSSVTTLSVGEANYLLANSTPPRSCAPRSSRAPDTLVEEAARPAPPGKDRLPAGGDGKRRAGGHRHP